MLSDLKKRFCVSMFLPIMDLLSCQLNNHFEGMKSVLTTCQVLETGFISSASHLDIEVKAKKNFLRNSLITSLLCFQAKCLQSKCRLKKTLPIKNFPKKWLFFIVKYVLLGTSYSDVCTAYLMYLTVPVRVATAEKSFLKLKLIKNFLRSSRAMFSKIFEPRILLFEFFSRTPILCQISFLPNQRGKII